MVLCLYYWFELLNLQRKNKYGCHTTFCLHLNCDQLLNPLTIQPFKKGSNVSHYGPLLFCQLTIQKVYCIVIVYWFLPGTFPGQQP